MRSVEAEWLWGWDPTPGIVSVHAGLDGRALVWRRITETDTLVRDDERFRPWLLLDRLDDLRHLGAARGYGRSAHTDVGTFLTSTLAPG